MDYRTYHMTEVLLCAGRDILLYGNVQGDYLTFHVGNTSNIFISMTAIIQT